MGICFPYLGEVTNQIESLCMKLIFFLLVPTNEIPREDPLLDGNVLDPRRHIAPNHSVDHHSIGIQVSISQLSLLELELVCGCLRASQLGSWVLAVLLPRITEISH